MCINKVAFIATLLMFIYSGFCWIRNFRIQGSDNWSKDFAELINIRFWVFYLHIHWGYFAFVHILAPITIWWVNMSTLCIHDLIQSIQKLFNTNFLHFWIHLNYFICKLLNSSFSFGISIKSKGFFLLNEYWLSFHSHFVGNEFIWNQSSN